MLLASKRRKRKPNLGASLNLGDPRTRGLRYCFAFNEGAGGYASVGVRNHAPKHTWPTNNPLDGTIGSSANVTWSPRGCLNWLSGTTSYLDCGANDDTTGEVTWLAWCRPTDLSVLRTIFGQNNVSGVESIDSLYIESNQLSWWIGTTAGGGSSQILNGSATLSANTSYRFAGRRSGTTGDWTFTSWVNEKQDDTATTASNPTIQTGTADGNFRVGFAGNYTGASWAGDFDFFALWAGVALKDDELLSLSVNPWQLWEKPRPRYWVNAAAAPAGGVPLGTLALMGVGR